MNSFELSPIEELLEQPKFELPRMDYAEPPSIASQKRNTKVLRMIDLIPMHHPLFKYSKIVHPGEGDHCGLCMMISKKNRDADDFVAKPFTHHYLSVIDKADGQVKTLQAPPTLMHTLQRALVEIERERQKWLAIQATNREAVQRFKKNKLEKRRGRQW